MKTTLLLALLFMNANFLFSQPGMLDKTFGENGILTSPLGNDNIGEGALVVSNDGRIISGNNGSYGLFYRTFRISVLLPDGTPDFSFGNNGTTYLVFPLQQKTGDYSFISSLALLPDGKILASGELYIGLDASYIAFARFLPNGKIDSSFGTNGTAIATFGYESQTAGSLTLQPDGKFLVGGTTVTNADQNFYQLYTARFMPDGSKDESYGTSGIKLSKSKGVVNSIALQKDGKIVAAGYSLKTTSENVFHLERYNEDGSYDNSFNGNGVVTTTIGKTAVGYSVTIQDDGKIVVAGKSSIGFTDSKFTVVRYNSDGSMDKGFGVDGISTTTFSQYSEAKKVLINNSERDRLIVCGSTTTDGNNYQLAIVSYNLDGSLDAGFANDGIQITEAGYSSVPYNAVLQKDGKILVTGYSQAAETFDYSLFYARYNGYPTQRPLFVRVKKWLQNHGISWKGLPATDNVDYYSVERSNNANKGFTQIAKVSGATHLNNYNLTNSNLLQGDNYYRIKAVTKTGGIVYSEVVNASNVAGLQANIYPNPATNFIVVKGLPANTKTKINLADASGKTIAVYNSNGATQYKVFTGKLTAGAYYVQLTCNGKTEMVKFVKQ